MRFTLVDVDDLLSSIETFVSKDRGAFKGFSQASTRIRDRLAEFLECARALGRAFDMELLSCQRMVDIITQPFLKLVRAQIAAAASRTPSNPAWLEVITLMEHSWTELLMYTLSGATFLDNKGVVQPVMRPKKRNELLDGLLEAKFPEVRPDFQRLFFWTYPL